MTIAWRNLALFAALALGTAWSAERRPIELADLDRLRTVDEPQLSPDGEWVAYTVQTTDAAADTRPTDLWLARFRDGAARQLTFSRDSESQPRWSADGRWLAFLSSRGDAKENAQLWTLSMAGGEAEKITSLPGSVEDFAISPDGRRVALIVSDAVDDAPLVADTKTEKPIVIDRYYFKEDITGYLGKQRQHLYLLDLATRATTLLTEGPYSEAAPSWSPDGQQLAFVSKRSPDPDRDDIFGIYLIAAQAGATPRLLATYQGEGQDTDWATAPRWSPDGRQLAFVAGGDPRLLFYAIHSLAVVDVATGKVRELTRSTDRNVDQPQWSRDGKALYAVLEDDATTQLVQVTVADGQLRRLTDALHEVSALTVSSNERIAMLVANTQSPAEVFAYERGRLRPLSRQNVDLLATLQLAPVERTVATSRDGTRITGFRLRPLNAKAGERAPTILRIHGGPVSQYAHNFTFEWQLYAARGFAVVAANPRGSAGRGEAFSKAIFADWGNLDAQDVLAHVDLAVADSVADPARLGVGGWSYGGMLTNYVIAQDTRFKAAVSGSSTSNILAGYGTDMYIREYEMELGPPWKNPDAWLKVSFPFLHADRIRTPTLFLCGSQDFNVPLLNSEQMYQALRSQNIPTQLVIYPGQFHGLTKPSYLKDRLTRYLDWYSRYLLQ